MLPPIHDYEKLRREFRWAIPERYNIGVDVCDRWAAHDPSRPAILHVQPDGGIDIVSFGAMKEASDRFANALRAHGIGRGDRVAILLPQTPEAVVAHIATYKLAAIALPLSLLFGPDSLTYRLQNSGAKAIVTNKQGLEKLAGVGDTALKLIVSTDGIADGALSFQGLLQAASDAFVPEDTFANDPAMMIYTSGTTGQPKGALHAHRVLLGHLPGFELPHAGFPQAGDLFWTPADWAWAGGLLNALLPALHHGVPVVARRFDKFAPDEAYALMAKTGIRNAFIPPTALRMLRMAPLPRAQFDLQLRGISSAGETLGAETFAWGKEAFGLTVNEMYGQTECNLVLASSDQLGVSRAGAIGKPVPGHDVAVIDAEGQILKPDEIGQIAVRRPSPVMFLEYWGDAEATRDKFIGDWMTTGDQCVVDDDGYFHFIGRNDDVITSASFRIGPGEIEDCLLRHPAVALAAAVGKPDPIRTEIVKAFVVLKGDVETPRDVLASELQGFVRTQLSAHEYPREIDFIDEMPMTTTGKIIRRILRERA